MSSQRSGQIRGVNRWISMAIATVLAGVGLIVVTPQEEAEAAAPGPRDTTAVLFSYTWNQIAEECTNTLGPAGYGYVQTSPPQEHVQGSQWWVYYQPVSYKLESRMGTEAEFINMVETCNEAGVEVIVDAVINHMSGAPQGGTGWAGTQFSYYEYPGLYSDNDFHSCRRDIRDYGNRWEVQECNLVGLSDLNTGSEYVQKTLASYLDRLSDLGVAGFRIDAVKHIAASDMWGIWNRVKDKDSLYVVQEVIRAHGEPIQPEEYLGIGDIHEFSYARSLKDAFRGGAIDWLISGAGIGSSWGGFLSHADAAVFVDNHDTERNGETLSYKDGRTYDLAQIFTLAWNYGSPSIHSGYEFTDYDAGPALDGSGRVIDPQPGQNGWTFKHAQNDIVNMVGFRNTTYGTDVVNKWASPDGRAIAFDRGNKGFVAINNGSSPVQREFTTSLPDGEYFNVISASQDDGEWNGDTVSVHNGRMTVTIPAKEAVALHIGAKVEECTDSSAPSIPGGLTAEVSGTTINLSWDESQHECGNVRYEVERTAGSSDSTVVEVNSNSLSDTRLDPLTTYTYRVRAVAPGPGARSDYSDAINATTDEKSAGTRIYFELPADWSTANIHYRVEDGDWTTAPGTRMEESDVDGWFSIELEAVDGQTITAAFNNGSTWDNNGGRDYTIPGGGVSSVSNGIVTPGTPHVPEPLRGQLNLFFKPAGSWASPHVHYRIGNGAWTTAPGVPMEKVDTCEAGDGWFAATISTGDAATVTAVFNNGSGTWDNNGGRDYVFSSATAAVSGGTVSAINPCGESGPDELAAPSNVRATPSGPDSVTVAWDGVTGAHRYEVEYRVADDDSPAHRAVVTGDTEFTITGLRPATEYRFQVRAVNATDSVHSDFSEPVTAVTDEKSAGTTVYFQLPIGWDRANIHYRIDSGPWTAVPGEPMTKSDVDGWFSADIEAIDGQTITAAFNNGSGTWDNNGGRDYTIGGGGDRSVASGTVTTGAPTVPEVLDGELTLYYKPTSSWTTPHVHYRVGNGAWTEVPGVPLEEVTACDAASGWFSTAIDTQDATRVTAAFNNGSGSWDNNGGRDYVFTSPVAAVNDGTVTTASPCGDAEPIELGVPQNTSAETVGPDAVTLSWDAVDGARRYEVEYRQADEGAPTHRATVAEGTTFTIGGLLPSTTYEFRVRATNATGAQFSDYSEPVTATTEDMPELTAPSNVVATATSATALRVSWDDVYGASHYQVIYQADGEGPTTATVSAITTSITGLQPDTQYSVTVAAIGADGMIGPSAPAVTVRTKAVSDEGEPSGSVAGATRGTPLGGDPREDSIYFIMTARWYDGDPSNNMGGPLHEKSGNAAYDDPMFRGDFSGIIEKLDYIKGLGFSAIWITPVVTNRSDYDFHGYHGWDFQRIDPRLESEGATYQELIDAAHDRGIKIYQDVVYNHSSRWGEKNLFVPTVYGVQDEEWSWYYDDPIPGKVYDPSKPNPDGSTYNGDLWSETQPDDQNCRHWGVQSGWSAEGYKVYNCQWPNATSGMFPSEYYHQCWIGNWEGKDAQDCWIHEDLADFNTESQVVQDYLIETYNKYIDMGVDGFRVDTAVHIPRVMWNRHFLPALHQHAVDVHGEKGKDFYVFGEVAQFVHDKWNRGSVNHSAPFYTWKERREYSLDDVVAAAEQFAYENDMGIHGQPTSLNHQLDGNNYRTPDHSQFSGMHIIDMRMHMNFSDASTAFHAGMDSDDATNDATFNAVYVDSHDYGPGKSSYRYDAGTDAWAENMSLMWTFRGIPVLYYGSEIEFQAGAQIDCGPSCPLATTGRAYFGDHLEGTVVASDFGVVESATGEVANTLRHPLVKHIQTLNQIRRSVPALQKGQYSREGVSGNIAYKKRFTEGDVDSFVLVAVSETATFSGIPNGRYVDAVTGDVKVVSDSSLTVSVSGKGNMRAYVLDLPGNPAPGKVGNGSDYLK